MNMKNTPTAYGLPAKQLPEPIRDRRGYLGPLRFWQKPLR